MGRRKRTIGSVSEHLFQKSQRAQIKSGPPLGQIAVRPELLRESASAVQIWEINQVREAEKLRFGRGQTVYLCAQHPAERAPQRFRHTRLHALLRLRLELEQAELRRLGGCFYFILLGRLRAIAGSHQVQTFAQSPRRDVLYGHGWRDARRVTRVKVEIRDELHRGRTGGREFDECK